MPSAWSVIFGFGACRNTVAAVVGVNLLLGFYVCWTGLGNKNADKSVISM